MKKQYKYILGTLLLFLSSCNNQSTNSSSIINDDNSSSSYEIEIEQEGNLHIGGDETKKPAYEYKKQTGSFTRKSFTFNNTLIKYIENPNSKITSSTVTTEIYDVSVEALSTTQAYKDGYHSILYTPDFYFAYTNSTDEYIDYIAIHNGLNYIVNEINEKGNSYIPLNGVVLSIPKDLNLNIDIGDTLKVEANIYKHALINQDNARLTFEARNEWRAESRIILFDREYGKYTKSNQYGCEIYVKYDFEKHSFVVKGFRGDNVVLGNLQNDHTHYGSYIPQFGFVLSAQNGNSNYQLYRQGRKFNIDDTLTFENYNFNTQYEPYYKFSKSPNDNPSSRQNNVITKYVYGGKNLDQYGYTNQPLYGAVELAVLPIKDNFGIVVSKGRELTCPENGYLLSCNSNIAQDLDKATKIGSVIKTTKNEVIISNEVCLSSLYLLEHYVKILQDKSSVGHEQLYDYNYQVLDNSLDQLIKIKDQIEYYYNDNYSNSATKDSIFENELNTMNLVYKAVDVYNKAYSAASQSNYVNARAGWLNQLSCNSLDEIKKELQHFKNNNINLIYILAFDGCTTFNSKYVPYDKDFKGNFGEYGRDNYLKAFVSEAHKLGMEVHGWTTNFQVGISGKETRLFDQHPEWQQKYYDGKVDNLNDEMTERDALYFDQANPEVHQFLIDFYNELLSEVDLDGFHLDYIRYAAGNDLTSKDSPYCKIGASGKLHVNECLSRSTGYTTYAMNDFLKTYNYDSSTNVKELVKNVNDYKKWTEYRTNKVTSFVEKIYNEVTKDKDLLLSIAIVPEVEHAILNKMQDWTTWINNGWIDILNGMHYNHSPIYINKTIEESCELLDKKVYSYPGFLMSVYYELPPVYNIYYYEAADYFNMGAAIFDLVGIWSKERIIYSDSNTDYEELLTYGTHRNQAVTPHSELSKVMDAFINDIEQRCNNLYIENNVMSKQQKDDLISLLKTFDNSNPTILLNQLTSLKNDLSKYASGNAVNRIDEYIDVMIEICNIRIDRN